MPAACTSSMNWSKGRASNRPPRLTARRDFTHVSLRDVFFGAAERQADAGVVEARRHGETLRANDGPG